VGERVDSDNRGLPSKDSPQSAAPAEPPAETTLRLVAEDVSVTKEAHETGRVRIATVTREREVLVDEELWRESVEIETVPVDRVIEAMPEVRHEGDRTIVPVVEEVIVVERRLVLKEEIHIRRLRTPERHQERLTLRYQQAVVTRQAPEGHAGGSGPAAEPEGARAKGTDIS
jgi:stress response protein YsnF